jgi:hypothetical protein
MRSRRLGGDSSCTYQGRDFSSLASPDGYKVSTGGYSYLFNICAPTGQPCGSHGANDTAVCQVFGSRGVSCGALDSGHISADSDAVAFNYGGGDQNRATSITIWCNWNAPAQPTDFTIENPAGSLSYFINGTSSAVCSGSPPPTPSPSPTPTPMPCTGPLGRDWSPLSSDTDYSATVGPYTYTFNVCKALTASCGGVNGAAACQTAASVASFSLGMASTQAIGKSVDGVSFAYSGGADGRVSSITFLCDRNAPAHPTSWSVINEAPTLTYAITGNSSLAC